MTRYRKKQSPGDNFRDLYSKFQQWISSALGDSSIDWDTGDEDTSLDVTANDSTVARIGHFGDAHGFLVIGGGTGWRTVQDDAQVRANAAEAAAVATANAHSNALDAAMDARVDTLNGEVNTLQTEMNTAQSDINTLQSQMVTRTARITALENYLTLYYYFPDGPP